MRKYLILSFIILFFIGCSQQETKHLSKSKKIDPHKPMSWGHQQTIYVFADDNVWKYAEGYLRQNLERFIFTTENEQFFEIKRAPIQNMDNFYKFNNLIFFSHLASNEPVSSYIKEIMSSHVKDDIKSNLVGMYPMENVWANDQFVLFILADNESNLLKFNILSANQIFEEFKEKLYERISGQVYKTPVYSAGSFKDYPWELKLPKKYILYKKDNKNNFISFIARLRNSPDRYISVYFEEMNQNEVGREWLKKKRAELAWKYYDEDEFKKEDVRIEKFQLGKHRGWKLSGRWQNLKYTVGGAFQSFAFFDEKSKKAYLIDSSVYYPEGSKLEALIELEIISSSIVIKDNQLTQGD